MSTQTSYQLIDSNAMKGMIDLGSVKQLQKGLYILFQIALFEPLAMQLTLCI
jgi:hypothetical protein